MTHTVVTISVRIDGPPDDENVADVVRGFECLYESLERLTPHIINMSVREVTL